MNCDEKWKKTAVGRFFFKMEGGHLVNANRFIQTPIDIDERVCNAIHGSTRGVRRHQTKKTSAVVRRRKITPQLLLTKQGGIIETEHKGRTKTKKNGETVQTRGLTRSPSRRRRSPLGGPEAKLIWKIPKQKFQTRTFLLESTLGLNLRRTSEGRPLAFKKTARSIVRKTTTTTKSKESVKSTIDNLELWSCQDIGSKRRHLDQFNTRMLWLRTFFKNVTGETTDAEESKEVWTEKEAQVLFCRKTGTAMKNGKIQPQDVFFSEWKAGTSWMPNGSYRPRSTSIKGSVMPYTARQEVSADTNQRKHP